ncbi:hypothetical protein TTHERM_00147550 (macronuclear) [Tetrahymena thermophila SB210]|uniref:Uncharacterized protein n=1 Tax=Tetrahymena thermophila (strain SB210) TaxID=312017 RepID=I7ML62_TETTS|nr:hypothetical protein TTHERM_00147550 [Tetrahymena thermophila SB210]EAS01244.1 hypothetical protein TTHERM_00147550 [Tetrahymena thermophila SB210]|eukprot:XP_001021489.1 hypothetical protein TTHERM_00147550 [Tetrahymena thermophila SB210]
MHSQSLNQSIFEKNSPLSASGVLSNTGMGKSGRGGAIVSNEIIIKDNLMSLDSIIHKIMLDNEKNTIEHYEKLTYFFQEQNEEEGRLSFREELLKFIQTEFRFQEMTIIDQENKDFVESIRISYKNMQELIKKGLKTTQSEIDYLNIFTKLLQIKEQLIKIYQDLGNYAYPISSDTLKHLQRYIRFTQDQKISLNYQGLQFYSNFISLELNCLMNLALTIQESEKFYEMYFEEKILFFLQRLKSSINEWISLFKSVGCEYSKFKQIVFLQNFHLLIKCKLDFYNRSNNKFKFQSPFLQVVQTYSGLTQFLNSSQNFQGFSNSIINQGQQQQQSQISQIHRQTTYPQNSSYPSTNKSCQTKLDTYLQDKQIFEKLFNKLNELYPQTVIVIVQKITSDKYKEKIENKKKEDQMMLRVNQNDQLDNNGQPSKDQIYGDYRICYTKYSMKESEFKEHFKSLMDYFQLQISLIDSYIECSKYIQNQQYLYYKLDEQYYLLFEVYKMDKKQINSIVDYISHLCEFLRNKEVIIASKDKSKPFRQFVDFIRDKLESSSASSNNTNIGSSTTLSSKGGK